MPTMQIIKICSRCNPRLFLFFNNFFALETDCLPNQGSHFPWWIICFSLISTHSLFFQCRSWANTTHYAYHNARLFKQTLACLSKESCLNVIKRNTNQPFHYLQHLLSSYIPAYWENDLLKNQRQAISLIFPWLSLDQRSGTYGSRAICGSFQDCIWLSSLQRNLSRLSPNHCKTENTSRMAFQSYHRCRLQLSHSPINEVSVKSEDFVVPCDTNV